MHSVSNGRRVSLPLLSWLAVSSAFVVGAVAAQEFGARARVARPLAARQREDATAAGTAVSLTDRRIPLESLRDVAREVPGALPFSGGGYGSFSSLSLRGTDLGQTAWLIGEIPLTGPDAAAFDMSLFPVAFLDRIEIYRGGAPLWLSQGSIGGVVRVVPRLSETGELRAQTGTGSFGLYDLFVSSNQAGPRVSLFAAVHAASAQNDYPYHDDAATRLVEGSKRDDDEERRLGNAQVADGSAIAFSRIALGKGSLDLLAFGIERAAGVPGPAGNDTNARHARRSLSRGLAALAYTYDKALSGGRQRRAQLSLSVQREGRTLDDPYAELLMGGPRALRQEWLRGSVRGAATLDLTRVLDATLVSSYTTDHFEDDDALRTLTVSPSRRHSEAVGGELRLHGVPFGVRSELRGSTRGEWTQTEIAARTLNVETRRTNQSAFYTYRAAAALEPVAGLTLRGAYGSGARPPAVSELFGDGGSQRENPRLTPERGRYADAGAVVASAFGDLCLSLEANGFQQDVRDKIIYVTNSPGQSIAVNAGRADILGVELGADLAYSRLARLVLSTTMSRSRGDYETALPRQPRLLMYGRAEVGRPVRGAFDRVAAFVSFDHVSTVYYDPANQKLRAPQTHVGLGTSLTTWHERLTVAGRLADVFDTRGQDYQRYPLPGRSFFVTASIREEIR